MDLSGRDQLGRDGARPEREPLTAKLIGLGSVAFAK
jgi:hypothetical protein